MPYTITTRSALTTLFTSALLACSTAALAEVDTSEWLCESCPFEQGYRADYNVGATYVSDDSARFGNATGYDEKGAYANVDGKGRYVDGDYRVDWTFRNLGLDSRRVEIDAGVQGRFGVSIGYREMPYRRFNTTETIFDATAANSLALPGGWVPAGTTSGFTQLDASLHRQDIGSDRKIVDLRANWMPAEHFDFYADFQRQNRDGVRISGGASFTQASLLPQWFDYETDRIDAGIRYATKRASFGIAYYGSFFTNNNTSLTWETPFTSGPGTAQLRKAQAPSNDFQQVVLAGAWRASPWDTVITLSLANGRGEQNEAFLPYTINPGLVAGALPQSSLDAEVDTSNYAFNISARPLPNGRVRFTYRADQRDNKTLQSDWNRIIVDAFTSGETEQNIPYSFDRSSLSLSGELLVWKDVRLSGGYDRKVLERDYQEVAKQTTDAGWGQVRWAPLDWLDFRIKGGTSERDIDRYDETVAISLGQNPLLRKYNLAYRFRSYGEGTVVFSPAESRWSATASLLIADDRYNQSLLGMTDSEETRATADLSFAFSDTASAYLMLGLEEIDAYQIGSEQFGTWDWSADHSDSFDHIGLGARWRSKEGTFDAEFSFNHGVGETAIRMTSLSGGSSSLPDLESNLDSLRIKANYRWSERLRGVLDIRYESFNVADWALVSPDTLPTVLTLGAEAYDYDLWAIGLGISYSFGDENIALVD